MVGPVALVALATQLIAGTLCNDLWRGGNRRENGIRLDHGLALADVLSLSHYANDDDRSLTP